MTKFHLDSMDIRRAAFTFVLLVLLSPMCRACSHGPVAVVDTPEGRFTVRLKLAKTDVERERGLMFETHLGEREGMLFLFDHDRIQSFWMKNTFLTLDLVFINREGFIVDYFENVPPCPAEPCPLYSPSQPVRYALEVKGGSLQRYHLQRGSLIRFQF